MVKKTKLFFLFLLVLISVTLIPQKKASAASKNWYSKYWKSIKESSRFVKFNKDRVSLNGYWKRSSSRISSKYEEKLVNKSFALSKYTRYYIQNMAVKDTPLIKVSKEKFKQRKRGKDSYCAFKIKNNKVVTAVLSTNVKAGPWKITQYGNNNGKQYTFYTLANPFGDFVIIDGGSRNNGAIVLSIIRKHGSRVRAWILSHSDTDHIGAFLKLMKKKSISNTIKIDKIYIPSVNNYKLRNANDIFHCADDIEDFIKILSKTPHVVRLKENSVIDLIGLRMKVYNSWDENVDRQERNQSNRGSLMFMLSGRSEKMLFCSDVEKEMEQYIVRKHRNELKADYAQLSHHGNNGLTESFYNLVEARKGVFADAPAFLWDDKTEKYDAPKLRKWFLSKGIPYFCFKSTPNTITLH